MKKIVLYGASGFGKEVAAIIESINRINPSYELMGFIDDGMNYSKNDTINDYPWLGTGKWIIEHKDDVVCTCTVGYAHTKAKIQRELSAQGVVFETIVHPLAAINQTSEIGPGCVIYSYVGVSVNCKIGAGVLLNGGVTVGHDVVIGDYTTVMPGTGISGAVKIGSEVSIGGHAFIIPERKIGDGATIAAGSIVFTNVRAGATVLGNPAKRMKELE